MPQQTHRPPAPRRRRRRPRPGAGRRPDRPAARPGHVHPGPALVTVKTGQLTLHRTKGCRSRTFSAGQTFLEYGPEDVSLTRNETGAVTETVVSFLLPVGAPVTVDAPAPKNCQL